jgi:hypothetical protein
MIYVEERCVEDHEVKRHGESDSHHQPDVGPRRHGNERLILRQAVHGVQHLNGDQHRQGHGHRVRIIEDVAVNVGPFFATASALEVMSLDKLEAKNKLVTVSKNRKIHSLLKLSF